LIENVGLSALLRLLRCPPSEKTPYGEVRLWHGWDVISIPENHLTPILKNDRVPFLDDAAPVDTEESALVS
jgi:hypothetical protein